MTKKAGSRDGTILIIVAGVAALLAMMSLAFLSRVRSDVAEMQIIAREAQARIMLTAACQYIQEASRIGWDFSTSANGQNYEAFGWIDVRDGTLGPRISAHPSAISPGSRSFTMGTKGEPKDPKERPSDTQGVGEKNFPINVPVRFPMYVMIRPPFAISKRATHNPVDLNAPDKGRSYLRYPDPMPALDNGSWKRTPANPAGTISNSTRSDWIKGDINPVQETNGKSWFRLVREPSGAIFTVTCGAGPTMGYKDWAEVLANNSQDEFYNSPGYFEELATQEVRLWYRVEWSPATTATDMPSVENGSEESFRMSPPNSTGGNPVQVYTNTAGRLTQNYSGQLMAPNMGGTIQWIQRLRKEPDIW